MYITWIMNNWCLYILGTQQMFQQLSPVLCDVSRHLFTMATSDASLESYLLPDNLLSIRIKTRLEELNQLVKV